MNQGDKNILKLFAGIKENPLKIRLSDVQQCIKNITCGQYFERICIYGENEVCIVYSKRGYNVIHQTTLYHVKKSFIVEQLEWILLLL